MSHVYYFEFCMLVSFELYNNHSGTVGFKVIEIFIIIPDNLTQCASVVKSNEQNKRNYVHVCTINESNREKVNFLGPCAIVLLPHTQVITFCIDEDTF